ncbi:MAG: hypothetical protein FJ240_03115 [Nitrospira sp.]|nr:hypothetical protein [Nitrospira sp.]
MKKGIVFSLLLVATHLLFVAIASADPRMETNNNFCHFILDPNNTDNEVFVADCAAVITTVEKTVQAGTTNFKCEESNRIASGYATVTKTVPREASPIPPGTTVVFTNADSGTPCTMVESNGRAYTSTNWESTIKAGPLPLAKNRISGTVMITVQYELFCREGRQ